MQSRQWVKKWLLTIFENSPISPWFVTYPHRPWQSPPSWNCLSDCHSYKIKEFLLVCCVLTDTSHRSTGTNGISLSHYLLFFVQLRIIVRCRWLRRQRVQWQPIDENGLSWDTANVVYLNLSGLTPSEWDVFNHDWLEGSWHYRSPHSSVRMTAFVGIAWTLKSHATEGFYGHQALWYSIATCWTWKPFWLHNSHASHW